MMIVLHKNIRFLSLNKRGKVSVLEKMTFSLQAQKCKSSTVLLKVVNILCTVQIK